MRPGEVLGGKYQIIRSLGSGGMGEVFLAEHTILEKKVAIKALRGFAIANDKAVRRFYREAQAAAALRHRGIAEVYDIGWEDNGRPYIVMEYLEGRNLYQFVQCQGGRLAPEAAAGIMVQVLSVLTTVHQNDIVHRDLKPENIFVCDDQDGESLIKILDFGVSKVVTAEDSAGLTQSGQVIGTVPYLAPELVGREADVNHRVDLWGVAAILYETITGQLPFPGRDVEEVLQGIASQAIIPPVEICSDVTLPLNQIMVKALDRNPDKRYQTAPEFRRALTSHFWGNMDHGKRDSVVVSLSAETTGTHTFPAFHGPYAFADDQQGGNEKSGRWGGKVPCLIVLRGIDEGLVTPIRGGELTLGRDQECSLVLTDESVSRRHAVVAIGGPDGHAIIEDTKSKNGITINGDKVSYARLHDGDQVTLGQGTLLKYSMLDPAEVAHHQEQYDRVAIDAVTGALNRRTMEARIGAEWSYAVRHDLELSFVAIEIDDFRSIDEKLGNQAADSVLRAFSRLVRGSIRGEDLFGRTGASQFLLVLQGTSLRNASRFSRRLRKSIGRTSFRPGRMRVNITVSIGVSTRKGTNFNRPQELINKAKTLLENAREAGGNQQLSL